MTQLLHLKLHQKNVYVFDWDGTVLDSMSMKARNFVQAFKSVFPESVQSGSADEVAEHYLRLSGHPRKYIFFRILDLLGLGNDEARFQSFNENFEALNKQNLIYAKLFPDATDLLISLAQWGHKIFISSSVPPKELADLVDKILPVSIRPHVSSVLGSSDGFSKGSEHLEWILSETNTTREQILVIGDDIADAELSSGAGIDCVLVDRKRTLSGGRFNTVSDLYQLRDGIKK